MSSVNPSGKAQRDRLVELEEQMLYLVEVPDSIHFLESHLEEIAEKTDMIDAIAGRVEGLPIQKLLARVDTLEGTVGRTGSHERGDSSTGSVAHIEERVQELDSSQKKLLEMINYMSEDFLATLDVVRNEIADVNARLSLTMRAMANLGRSTICGGPDLLTCRRDKLCELKHIGSIREYVKQFAGLMLDIRDMSEKDKVFCFVEGLKPWAKTKLYEQRVQDLTSAYAAVERLFDLSSDSQDARRYPSFSSGGSRNNRPSSPKTTGGDRRFNGDRTTLGQRMPNKTAFNAFQASLASDSDNQLSQTEREVDQTEEVDNPQMEALKFLSSLQKKVGETNTPVERGLMYVDTWINQKPTKSTMVDSGATHNSITEAEAKCLNLCWEKDAGRMKVVNFAALPIIGLVK
ncbi:reverse transcriptase [Cucumis melo var. makuwa]|uniref:Reverse transcriptase n=1 Tax=Cucumis melo var. makuwa TaxID=1194695 RepID=A0A5A7TEV3_CUCMM|nr:reverse transcriptase [Cucumis melo var. makuwa]TYK17897.1 reverse transcriptase [Cucumis melo var. makuwa]